jgi:1,2-diacylglycerol 3-beta-galactosyltransferase
MKVTILMSDTGGGHRSVAAAVEAALVTEKPEISVELVDGLLDYSPYPLNRLPDWYPTIITRFVGLWRYGYVLSDDPVRARLLHLLARPFLRSSVHRFVEQHQCDLLVSTHPMLVSTILDGLGVRHPPFVTVVTDLVTAHAWWFDSRADLTLVPTEEARVKALKCGLASEQVQVAGLPVSASFSKKLSRKSAREKLVWDSSAFTVLLIGGAEGMAPLWDIANALRTSDMSLQLAIVCGRNERLLSDLKALDWPITTHMYGFLENVSELIRGADVVITKAGPSTIMEVLNCGRPLLLCGAIPGQEDGNVDFVLKHNLGWWTPFPDDVLSRLKLLQIMEPGRIDSGSIATDNLLVSNSASTVASKIIGLLPKAV